MNKVQVIGGFGEKKYKQWYFQDRIYDINGLCPALTTLQQGYWIYDERSENNMGCIKYLSLFSGIGGFEYGIQQSKYKDNLICVGYSEVDEIADSIYRKRFPNKMVRGTETYKSYGDVRNINTSDLPNFELLVGGFPCQSFSIAGKRGGFDDTRGTLFFEIARILKDKRPKYFLLENVKGLLSHNKGETFKTILGVLSELGYDVEWEVFNSSWFGVPQKRERIYLKGYSRRECGREIFSQRASNEEISYGLSEDKIDGNLHNKKEQSVKIRNATHRGFLEANEEEDGICISWSSSNTRRGRVHKESCGTLDTGSSWGVFSKNRIRRLTPSECETLQGFPKGWTEFGVDGKKISDHQRYKCLGNAVTTNVITWIINNWNIFESKEV